MKRGLTIALVLCLLIVKVHGQWTLVDSIPIATDCIGAPQFQTFIFENDSTSLWYHSYPSCSPTNFPGFNAYITQNVFDSIYGVSCNPCTEPRFTFINSDTIIKQYNWWSVVYYCERSVDGGQTWNQATNPINSNKVQFSFYNAYNGYGFDGSLFMKYHNDTIDTLNSISSFTINICEMKFKSNGEGCVMLSNNAGGNGVRIIKTPDEGATWISTLYFSNRILYKMQFFNDSVGVVVADSGYVYKTTDFGSNWSFYFRDTSGTNLKFIDLAKRYYVKHFSASNNVLYFTNDSGTTWNTLGLPTKCNSYSAYLFDGGYGYLRGNGPPFFTNYIYKISNYTTDIMYASEEKELSLKIFPNPNNLEEKFSIELNGITESNQKVKLSILNMVGENVFRSDIITIEENQVLIQPKIRLASGLYIVESELNGTKLRKKFIVQ